jgi:hypothetical protein
MKNKRTKRKIKSHKPHKRKATKRTYRKKTTYEIYKQLILQYKKR